MQRGNVSLKAVFGEEELASRQLVLPLPVCRPDSSSTNLAGRVYYSGRWGLIAFKSNLMPVISGN